MPFGPGTWLTSSQNQKPWGVDTSGVARPKVGSVLYGGAGVYNCKKTGDIALTFDDGPYKYTADLLDKLRVSTVNRNNQVAGETDEDIQSYGAKATFFITGNNLGKGHINDPATEYPAIIKVRETCRALVQYFADPDQQRMHQDGHQIASHTWSHENATKMTNAQFKNQMVWNEIAINSLLGFFPTYMR